MYFRSYVVAMADVQRNKQKSLAQHFTNSSVVRQKLRTAHYMH